MISKNKAITVFAETDDEEVKWQCFVSDLVQWTCTYPFNSAGSKYHACWRGGYSLQSFIAGTMVWLRQTAGANGKPKGRFSRHGWPHGPCLVWHSLFTWNSQRSLSLFSTFSPCSNFCRMWQSLSRFTLLIVYPFSRVPRLLCARTCIPYFAFPNQCYIY